VRAQPTGDGGEDRISAVVDGDDVAVPLCPDELTLARREQGERALGGVRRDAVVLA